MHQLREYQSIAVEKVIDLFRTDARPVLYSPTGSGKTEMAQTIIDRYVKAGKKTMFCANRIELVSQASRRFMEAGLEHGILQGENSRNAYAPFVISSIQTLMRRGELAQWMLNRMDLIVIDEAHGVSGSEQYRELMVSTGADIVGLTATPFSKGLGKYFSDIVVAATIRDLIEQQFLVDVDVFAAPEKPDLKGVKITAGDYNMKDLSEEMNKKKLVGNIVEHWLKLGGGKSTVIFATDIAHSMSICERFRQSGILAGHVDAYTPEDQRRETIDAFGRGEITVICNCSVLAEGWDAPRAEVMILARPTKSLIRHIQMAGRVLRMFPGKERALILDHSDTVRRLGFPTDDLPLVLHMGEPNKADATTELKEERQPKECPSCGFMKPIGVLRCSECGFAPTPKAVVEVEGTLEQLRRQKQVERDSIVSIYEQMLGYTRGKGWKDGAAYMKTIEYFAKDTKIGVIDEAKAAGVKSALRGHKGGPRPPGDKLVRWIRAGQIKWREGQKLREARVSQHESSEAPPF